MPTAFKSLGAYWKTVVGLDHPDAPTSKITPHEKPLNIDSFKNSGIVILRAIEQLILNGTLDEGVTAVGVSTGCPVLMEAVAQDIREANDGLHERYIKQLILVAPAGLMDRKNFAEIAAGAAGGTLPYLLNLKYIIPHLYFKITVKKYQGDQKRTLHPISRQDRDKNIADARLKPEWKSILGMHIAFEHLEFFTSRLPFTDLIERFHRIWPN